jgi:NAD(P)-dependent dehydrogenase (short-subunit alcohol dehydrogenase family)
MSAISIKPETFKALRDKVVVIIGGAAGIGAVTVTELLCMWSNTPRSQPEVEQHADLRRDQPSVLKWCLET